MIYNFVYTFSKTLAFHLLSKLTVENVSYEIIYKLIIGRMTNLFDYYTNKKLLTYNPSEILYFKPNFIFKNYLFPKINDIEKNYELTSVKSNNINYILYDKIDSHKYSDLNCITLNYNNLTYKDVELISKAKKKYLPKLTTLNLSHNSIQDDGAIVLANNIDKLRYLNISNNNIGLLGYVILFEKYIAHDIENLNIDNNLMYDQTEIDNIPEFDIITENEENCEWILV